MAADARAAFSPSPVARRGFAWAPDWRALFAGALGARGRGAALLPVDSGRGDGRRGAQSRRRPRAGAVAAGAADGAVRRARLDRRGRGRWRAGCWSAWRRSRRAFCRWACAPRGSRRRCSTTSASSSCKGFVEEVDFRPVGARLVLAVVDRGDMPADLAPRRVRVTTRKTPNVAAGDYVALQARLLPPSRAVLPGGYDFARDAYFAGVGAVGSTLGAISVAAAAGRRGLAPARSARRSTTRAIGWRCASTRSSAATRARSPRRW